MPPKAQARRQGLGPGPGRPWSRAPAGSAAASEFTLPAPLGAARRGPAGIGAPEGGGAGSGAAPAPGRVFPEAFGAGAAERKRQSACRRGRCSPLLLCEGKAASPFHGRRPLRAPFRVCQAAATALGKMAVLSLVSE